jgi:hypothetical protein
MFGAARLRELDAATNLAALESQILRGVCCAEFAVLRDRTARLRSAAANMTGSLSFLVAGAALAGLLAPGRWRTLVRLAVPVLAGLRWWRSQRGRS